jgi:hypothetical protein
MESKKEKKGKKEGTRIGKEGKGRSMILESQGIPVRTVRRDYDDSGACPPRYSYRPNHNKYVTGTDTCMPLAVDRTAGERVVPSTQTRLDKEDDEGAADERDIWEVAHVAHVTRKTSKPLRVRRRIYMTNLWR